MGTKAIVVSGVWKQFQLGLIRGLSIRDTFSSYINGQKQSKEKFWALRDINFQVNEGESLGIIGRNGAGKSTLLKILSRITEPSKGRIEINGRLASLLEVGTGFHPELTGRDNIYLNGTILGMTKKEISRKYDEIVEFSGVEKFLDTPVKRYSSGMYVRLAFAVAAHIEPEILVVDEVLSVGDAEFQKKCLGKLDDVTKEGRTVIFVSHNMAAMKSLCRRGLEIRGGQIVNEGDIDSVVDTYLNQNLLQGDLPVIKREQIDQMIDGVIRKEPPFMRITSVSVLSSNMDLKSFYETDEQLNIRIELEVKGRLNDLRIMFQIVNSSEEVLLASQTADDPRYLKWLASTNCENGKYVFTASLPENVLSEYRYFLTIEAIHPKIEHIKLRRALYFDMKFKGFNGVQYGNWSTAYLRPQLRWTSEKID